MDTVQIFSLHKQGTQDRSNNLSTKNDHENDIVATFNILDSPYNYKNIQDKK